MELLHYIMTFQAACYLVLLARLWRTGLASRYRFLCGYLALEALVTGGMAWISIRTWTYTIVYFCVTPLLWVLSYLVVLELCWLILEDYPGIAAAGRRIVSWTMGIAVLIAAVFAARGLMAGAGRYPVLRSFELVHLSVRAGLLFFLLAIMFFAYRFRLNLPRNRKIYGVGYALCWGLVFISDALSIRFGDNIELYLNYGEMLICSALLLVGAAVLNPAGEFRPAVDQPDTSARREDLHRKLTEINQVLMKIRVRQKESD